MKIQYENENINDMGFPIIIKYFEKNKNNGGIYFHWHEKIQFYHILSGSISILCNGNIDTLLPGDVCFINWCQLHKNICFSDNTKYYIVQVSLDNPLFSFVRDMNSLPTFIHNNKKLRRSFNRILKQSSDITRGSKQKILGEMFIIVGELMNCIDEKDLMNNKNSENNFYILKILDYIHNNYKEKFSLSLLSQSLKLSEEHICRMFKNHTDTTITNYIMRIRINTAVSLLIKGLSVTDAAYEVGYLDYNYFSRIFKKIMGVPPSKVKQLFVDQKIVL